MSILPLCVGSGGISAAPPRPRFANAPCAQERENPWENVCKRNTRLSLNSAAFTNIYLFFFPEAKACDKTPIVNSWCVCVKKELGISRNTFPCNWVLSTQMICVVVLRLVGSQAVSNAKVCVFSPWLKPVCNRAQWWKQMSHPVHSAALHITHCLHTKRAGEEKGQKKVRGDHPPSLYLRPFLVIKAWSLYWTCSNCLGAKHLSQRRKSAWGSECR